MLPIPPVAAPHTISLNTAPAVNDSPPSTSFAQKLALFRLLRNPSSFSIEVAWLANFSSIHSLAVSIDCWKALS